MNLADWHAILGTEPATPNQVGAIIAEFGRLGVGDRDERLAISAALLGLGDLVSTTQLVQGQAGRLVRILREISDRAELRVLAADDDGQDQADAPGSDGMSLIDAIQAMIVALLRAMRDAEKPQGNTGRRTYVQTWPGHRDESSLRTSAKITLANCPLAARGRGSKTEGRGIPRRICRPCARRGLIQVQCSFNEEIHDDDR